MGATSHFASAKENHEKLNIALSFFSKHEKLYGSLGVEVEKLSGFKAVLETIHTIHLSLSPHAFSLRMALHLISALLPLPRM